MTEQLLPPANIAVSTIPQDQISTGSAWNSFLFRSSGATYGKVYKCAFSIVGCVDWIHIMDTVSDHIYLHHWLMQQSDHEAKLRLHYFTCFVSWEIFFGWHPFQHCMTFISHIWFSWYNQGSSASFIFQ